MSDIWESYRAINSILASDFLCIPPYRNINAGFVNDCLQKIYKGDSIYSMVSSKVINPFQRAYQMEYRFKKADIFMPYIPVIEYATFDAMQGNWICAYLSLLPVVEAVLREWAEKNPTLTFNKVKGFGETLSKYLKETLNVYEDERVTLIDGYVGFFKHMISEVMYLDFDTYENAGFSDVFNRNLALHKLDGVIDIKTGLLNVTRTLLLLDIIAELYLLQEPQRWWKIVFYANPNENLDFQLRWQLYIKRAKSAVGTDDLIVIENAFLNSIDDEKKIVMINKLKAQIALMRGMK